MMPYGDLGAVMNFSAPVAERPPAPKVLRWISTGSPT